MADSAIVVSVAGLLTEASRNILAPILVVSGVAAGVLLVVSSVPATPFLYAVLDVAEAITPAAWLHTLADKAVEVAVAAEPLFTVCALKIALVGINSMNPSGAAPPSFLLTDIRYCTTVNAVG